MSKIRCFKCKGKGEVWSFASKFAVGFSLGLLIPLAVVLKDECSACGGKGYLEADNDGR
jgi:hypothetical protein